MEMPNVVKAWKNYKDSSFVNGETLTVISVSLDRAKDPWVAAIKHDSLVWPCHVSDLQYWNNAAAQQYQVFSIPFSLLIDGNGVIIAKGEPLRGEGLERALSTQTIHKAKSKGGKKPKKEKKDKKPAGNSAIIDERRKSFIVSLS